MRAALFQALVLLLAVPRSTGFQTHRSVVATTSQSPWTCRSPSRTKLDLIPEVGEAVLVSTSAHQIAAATAVAATSPEPIHTAFSVATFLPQPFWLLMILFPNKKFTRTIMGGLEVPLLCSLVHFFIVVTSVASEGSGGTAPLLEFNDVFDPFGDPQRAFVGMTSNYPNFDAEEWSHVLTWDLFVGRYIWLDGLKRGIFTGHSVLFCNLIGPPGLLLHWVTCAVTGKPLLDPSEKQELDALS